jgi:hypothetical protein
VPATEALTGGALVITALVGIEWWALRDHAATLG